MNKNKIVTISLVLLLSFFVIFLRARLISLSGINKIARSEVYNDSLEKIKNKVDERYADFPGKKRAKLISQSYKDYLKQNKHSIQEKIKEKAREKKAFYQNDNNHTYLFGIDSYYWLRLIDNLINKGHIGDSIVDGKNYDDLIDMPIEQSFSRSIHIILGSFIYKIFGFLNLDIDYEFGLYFIPLLFSVLLVFFTFFITKLMCKSNTAAFFATIAVSLAPLLLHRTTGEWLDTDIYNVFFPLLIFWSFLFVFKSANTAKKSLGLAVFAFACALYASIWQGWWFILDLLIISGFIFIVNDYFSEGKDKALFKKNILWIVYLFISGIILVGLFNGKESFFSFISEPGKMIFALKSIPKDNWPNVFLTVGELKKINPYTMAKELGGVPIFFVTIIGSIYLVLSKKILRDKELGIGFFCLFIWLSTLYYASLSAVRFALLMIVPLGIMFGIVFDKAIREIFVISLRFSKKIHFLIMGALVLIIYLFVSFYVTRSIDIISSKFPMMNDAWYKSLTFIKSDSDKNTIINSWWDYGHWFKAVAQRPVLFDGKTQNSPVAFWMAKVLTTDDEEEAIGILRMLDISKNKAFDLLESYGLTHVKAINILRDIVKLPQEDARQYLGEVLDKEKTQEVISLLYSSNMPSAYFIASYDMIGKMRSISHIGNWDFQKGDIWIHLSGSRPTESINYLKKEYGYTQEKARGLLADLSLLNDQDALGWISKISNIRLNSLSNKFKKEENLLLFDNGLVLDLSNFNAYICRGLDIDIGIPYSVVYAKDAVLQEKVLDESNLDYSALIFEDEEGSYKCVFLDKDLTQSMFIRMYFYRGEGLKYFKKVLQEKTPEGNSVYIYNIEWQG